jgi:DNA-directed RNA polymerase subunit M/transcription elongation factor TFIIS
MYQQTDLGRVVRGVSRQEQTQRAALPDCPRCNSAMMSEILTIAPTLHEPGLIAYECHNCGYISSILTQRLDQQRR